jgi:filamentous hemagglutinin
MWRQQLLSTYNDHPGVYSRKSLEYWNKQNLAWQDYLRGLDARAEAQVNREFGYFLLAGPVAGATGAVGTFALGSGFFATTATAALSTANSGIPLNLAMGRRNTVATYSTDLAVGAIFNVGARGLGAAFNRGVDWSFSTAGRGAVESLESGIPTASELPPGSFSISDWSGYPAGVPRPQGPFRLVEGAEYDTARALAKKANAAIRRDQGLAGQAVDVHEIQPVKFGGSPTDPANKIIISRDLHMQKVTPWWNKLQKGLGK